MTVPSRKGASLGTQIGYGIGQIAGQVFRDVPSLMLLFYLTTVIGINVGVAGMAIFIPKLVFGVGCDMLVGILSDRWRQHFARRWWLLLGAALSPLAMILLFHIPEGSEGFQIAYVAISFSLYMAVFASFSVPYLAIAGELSGSAIERTKLMAWRLVFTAIGVLVAGAVAPMLAERFGGDAAGYRSMSLVLAVICPVSLLIAFFGIGKTRSVADSNHAEDNLIVAAAGLTFAQAFAVLTRRRFAVLFSANFLQLVGSGMGYASLLYFIAYNMGRADALSVVGLVVMAACAGIIVAQPMWVAAAGKVGKTRSYVFASIIYSASYFIWMFCADLGVWVAYVLAFTAAIGNSGWAMLSFAMLADISSDDEDHAGLYSAAWVAADKIAFALGGTLLVGGVLSGFGFDAQKAMNGMPQTDQALLGVALAFGLCPVLLNLAGAALLGFKGEETRY